MQPIDKGLDSIESAYPESSEVIEIARKGLHLVNSLADTIHGVAKTTKE